MKIGILCACAPEFEPYRATLGGESTFIHGMQRTDGVLCGHEISAVFCGIGKVNAALGTMTLIRDCGADRIIMSGVAGAIRRGVHIGQCVMIFRLSLSRITTQAASTPTFCAQKTLSI